MNDNAQLLAAINALTENTKNDAINWTRINDNKYTHAKSTHGKIILEQTPPPKRQFTLTATDSNATPNQKLKATSQDADPVHTALETLWKSVAEDYGNDGVKFLEGFVKSK